MTAKTYEVQTFTLCDGWINCWTVHEGADSYPQTFATPEEAQAEIDELFSDIEEEIKSGNRQPDEGYDREDFRIVETGGQQ